MQGIEETDTVAVRERIERRDAAESRRRILAEAQRLFTEHGVEAVSMHAIAQAAGVGQGTLYRRYANKGDLCFDLIKESADSAIAGIVSTLEASKNDPPLGRLDSVLGRIVAFMEEKVQLMGAIRDAYCGEQRAMQFSNPFYRWIHTCVASLLAEAVARGDVQPLDPTFTADAILGAISPNLYEFQRRERGLTPEQILSGMKRLYTAGLH
jgi:AcrR family transcriptional regulator